MLFKDITTVDRDFNIKEHMYLGTEENKITYLSDKEPEDKEKYGEEYKDTKNRLFIPGFFNAHAHTAMYLLRGYGEGLALSDWLNKKIFPFEAQLTPDDIYKGTLAGALEMLKFGIVSATDMYFSGNKIARAFIDAGMKANVGACCSEFEEKDYRLHKTYPETLDMKKNFHGYDDGRILIDFALHSEYTSNPVTAKSMVQICAEEGLRMQVHLSETASEVEECKQRHGGMTPPEYFNSIGFFEVPVTAAHCVHLTENDIAILKEKKVHVASCPKSNLKLSSGICQAKKLIDSGINVNVATDGVSSNNNVNMLEEMKFFSLLQKYLTGDASVLDPKQTLYAATRAGALSQGRDDCGLIAEGFKADIIALDTSEIHWGPAHDLLNNLLYSSVGTDVKMTMVDGKIVYENGEHKTLDTEKVRAEADEIAFRISKQVNS